LSLKSYEFFKERTERLKHTHREIKIYVAILCVTSLKAGPKC